MSCAIHAGVVLVRSGAVEVRATLRGSLEINPSRREVNFFCEFPAGGDEFMDLS